jgi:hypothetical protein
VKGTKQANRYSLYKYSDHHWAIDCEDCDGKICNFTPSDISGAILDKLNKHEEKRHPA